MLGSDIKAFLFVTENRTGNCVRINPHSLSSRDTTRTAASRRLAVSAWDTRRGVIKLLASSFTRGIYSPDGGAVFVEGADATVHPRRIGSCESSRWWWRQQRKQQPEGRDGLFTVKSERSRGEWLTRRGRRADRSQGVLFMSVSSGEGKHTMCGVVDDSKKWMELIY